MNQDNDTHFGLSSQAVIGSQGMRLSGLSCGIRNLGGCYTIEASVVTSKGPSVAAKLKRSSPPDFQLGTFRRDRKKVGGLKAGPTDQGAVDVGDCQQFPGIGGFDRTAIEDAHPGPLCTKARRQSRPNKLMNLLNIFRCRGEPSAYRPNRLISHHKIISPRSIGQGTLELIPANGACLTQIALLAGFADANDGGQLRPPGGLRLLAHQAIRFAMVGPALRMADNNGLRR